MLSTTLVAALGGLLAVSTQPTWVTDYRSALVQAANQHKPVAVFIAQGSDGYAKLVAEGTLGTDAVGTLRQNYVALYVDTATADGRETAATFGMSQGLVISNRNGGIQALRHQGTLSQADLTGYLARFSAEPAVATTEHHSTTPVSAPVYQAAPVYQIAPSYSPFAQPSCPNGRCPYAK